MSTLLHIHASPREESLSHHVAGEFLDSFCATHRHWTVETLDLFKEEVPAFTCTTPPSSSTALLCLKPM